MHELPVTPIGTVVYAAIGEPKLNNLSKRLEYYLAVKFPREEVEALQSIFEGQIKEFYANKVTNKALSQKGSPVTAFENKAGEKTGELMLQFKTPAQIIRKNGEVIDQTVPLFNRRGEPVVEDVFGGAIIRVSYLPYLWEKPGIGYGMSLQLKSIQIAKPAKTRDATNPADWGFDAIPEEMLNGY